MSSESGRPFENPVPSLDSVTTIRSDGSRRFLHPADSAGRFTLLRKITGWGLIVLYLSLPWIKIGGFPAVFLDVASRRFHFFGWTAAAQDMWLLFFVLSGTGFLLFFVTALLGRVWCGWACPQTVFLEQVFRRLERWIEGDALARRKLDAAPWTASKVIRRGAKQAGFAVLSLVITHLFLAYFVSVPALWSMMRAAPTEHGGAFLFVFVFAGILYFNFAWFREQLCIVLCPYGRLQSVLIDDDSLVIGYDARRGEPRGRFRREAPQAGPREGATGDCVDCHRCVAVCPTGIDIRQGLQIECIGCTACIDACDEIMARLKRPAGLIRYDSLNGLGGRPTRWVRPRTIAYAVLLLIGGSAAAWAVSTVRPAAVGLTRMVGSAYFFDGATVRNQFFVRLVNKQDTPQQLLVQLRDVPAGVVAAGLDAPVALAGMGEEVRPLVVVVPRSRYAGAFHFTVVVRDEAGTFELTRDAEFLGPDPGLLREDEEAHEGPNRK
jgi:cytochrome c oxidase accessory protein FixG